MKIKIVAALSIFIISSMFGAAGLYAGTEVPDEFKMENKIYNSHDKGIVLFTHKKHIDDYKAWCWECHHNENNQPLNDLKIGDDVKKCSECHKKPEYIKGKKAKGLSKEEKREYHANAIHDNCKGCHKKFNKKMKLKSKDEGAAQVTCKQCHPKKK